jgi:hypothetical protein
MPKYTIKKFNLAKITTVSQIGTIGSTKKVLFVFFLIMTTNPTPTPTPFFDHFIGEKQIK